MDVLFVYSLEDVQGVRRPLRSWATIQFGISHISSVLKAEGHRTRLLVLGSGNRRRDNLEQVRSVMDDFAPRLVCFTAVASQYPFIERTAGAIRSEWPAAYRVIGGVHATLNPSEAIAGPFDAVCVGEGEHATLDLCRRLEAGAIPAHIANLWLKSADGHIEKNLPRPFHQDIDGLPFPDREMWIPWMQAQPGAELAVLLGRGCPYDCTYCCNHALKHIASGKYVRLRSPESIIDELARLHAAFPTHSRIFLEVESIALNTAWLTTLCEHLEAFNSTIADAVSYGCNFRITPQSTDEKVFSALKRARVDSIRIGLESGSERVRREILKRDYSNTDLATVTAMARKHDLKIFLFNMIGLPGETRADHMDTVSLNRQCQPDGHFTGIFFPYPGTDLYDLCVRKGFVATPLDYRLERKRPVVDTPQFPKARVRRAYIWFDYHVYRGRRPLWWVLMQTGMTRIRASMTLNRWFRRIVRWPGLREARERLART